MSIVTNCSDSQESWTYLSEGNANIVLTYSGSNPLLRNTVLRLSKTTNTLDSHLFIKYAIEPLLTPWVLTYTKINLSPLVLQTIGLECFDKRPAHRLGSEINQSILWGYSSPDMTHYFAPASTLTIEIKPKWGFKPNSSHISEHHSIKQRMCRYCMHSNLKKLETLYCPLDIYSKDPIRVRRAIECLLNTKGDQLRLFLDGKRLELHQSTQASITSQLLGNWFGAKASDEKESSVMTIISELVQKVLDEEVVLNRLKLLQKHCDELDVEGIIKIYEKYSQMDLELDLEGWIGVTSNLLKRLGDKDYTGVVDERQRLYEYVLSMTLKDCSLMISISEQDEPSPVYWCRDNRYVYYQYAVKLIDLDLKDIKKIPKWFDLDQRIVKNAIQHGLDSIL
ncbi:inositol-pentakisphosphate 2-kinase [Phycomyces blakesleeanus]